MTKKDLDAKIEALTASAVDEGIELSEKEKEAIEAEVKAEIAKELKAEKRKEYKASTKSRLKKQVLFQHGKDEAGEDTELVMVQLAPHQPFLRFDNNLYYSGQVYRLSPKKAAVVKEQMYRGYLHDNEISGKNMAAFYGRRPQNAVLNPNTPLPAGLN